MVRAKIMQTPEEAIANLERFFEILDEEGERAAIEFANSVLEEDKQIPLWEPRIV